MSEQTLQDELLRKWLTNFDEGGIIVNSNSEAEEKWYEENLVAPTRVLLAKQAAPAAAPAEPPVKGEDAWLDEFEQATESHPSEKHAEKVPNE